MFALQASMNSKIDPDWVKSRYPYLLAVVIEGSEAIEHHGWKWWKKQSMDLPQLQMELIDIWHFMLSEILLRNDASEEQSVSQLMKDLGSIESQTSIRFDEKNYETGQLPILEQIELLIGLSAGRRIEVGLFAAIMKNCDLTWADLYSQYVGKNILNLFRQDHGYKEGSYQKMWANREDNEHLVDILSDLDPTLTDYKERLYSALQARYPD